MWYTSSEWPKFLAPQQTNNPDVIFKTLPNKSTHVNSSFEHHFFRWVLYGIPKPTTKIPSKVLLNSPVSDVTLTSEGVDKIWNKFTCFHSAGGENSFLISHTGEQRALCNALELLQ